jgi:hypothetical protein
MPQLRPSRGLVFRFVIASYLISASYRGSQE